MSGLPLNGQSTVNDMVDRINEMYNSAIDLSQAGVGGESAIFTGSADNFPLGTFGYFSGTEAECRAANLPAIVDSVLTTNRVYVIITIGLVGSSAQFATELLSIGVEPALAAQQFKRTKANGVWMTNWLPVGSGSGAKDGIFYSGKSTVVKNTVLADNVNHMAIGPLTIAPGVVITVPPNASFVVV